MGKRTNSQNFKNHSGSVIKILKNGKYYNNNAFKNALPEILTIGHKNPQGLVFNPKINNFGFINMVLKEETKLILFSKVKTTVGLY